MIERPTAACLVATLIGTTALAQSLPPAIPTPGAPPSTNPGSSSIGFITRREPGVLRASDFIGRDVYDERNIDIGDVADVLIGSNGEIIGLVIEVAGSWGSESERSPYR